MIEEYQKCPVCSAMFATTMQLVNHKYAEHYVQKCKHLEDGMVKCSTCDTDGHPSYHMGAMKDESPEYSS